MQTHLWFLAHCTATESSATCILRASRPYRSQITRSQRSPDCYLQLLLLLYLPSDNCRYNPLPALLDAFDIETRRYWKRIPPFLVGGEKLQTSRTQRDAAYLQLHMAPWLVTMLDKSEQNRRRTVTHEQTKLPPLTHLGKARPSFGAPVPAAANQRGQGRRRGRGERRPRALPGHREGGLYRRQARERLPASQHLPQHHP